jgi:hypothetical protein
MEERMSEMVEEVDILLSFERMSDIGVGKGAENQRTAADGVHASSLPPTRGTYLENPVGEGYPLKFFSADDE